MDLPVDVLSWTREQSQVSNEGLTTTTGTSTEIKGELENPAGTGMSGNNRRPVGSSAGLTGPAGVTWPLMQTHAGQMLQSFHVST